MDPLALDIAPAGVVRRRRRAAVCILDSDDSDTDASAIADDDANDVEGPAQRPTVNLLRVGIHARP